MMSYVVLEQVVKHKNEQHIIVSQNIQFVKYFEESLFFIFFLASPKIDCPAQFDSAGKFPQSVIFNKNRRVEALVLHSNPRAYVEGAKNVACNGL